MRISCGGMLGFEPDGVERMLDRLRQWWDDRHVRRAFATRVAVPGPNGTAELRPVFQTPASKQMVLTGAFWQVRNALDAGEPVTEDMLNELRGALTAWVGEDDPAVASSHWEKVYPNLGRPVGRPEQQARRELEAVRAVLLPDS
jgi:hypothetical protein